MHENFSDQTSTPKQCNSAQKSTPRLWQTHLFMRGTALALLLLFGALAAAITLNPGHSAAHASGGAPTPTLTVGTPGQLRPTGSLYPTTTTSLTRVDLRTGQAIWTIPADYPSAPLVPGQMLIFENQDSANPLLEAVSTTNGAKIWSTTHYASGILVGSNTVLFDSSCDLSALSDPCHLYGISTRTGQQLWSYDLPQGDAWTALQNGVLYGVSNTSYFALKASTGAVIWQQDLPSNTQQEANMTPVISGNLLSFATCYVGKLNGSFAGCYLYAFSTATGTELWHATTASSMQATPTILNGVIYAGTIDGTLSAFNAQDGTSLWSTRTGGAVAQVTGDAGTIYAEAAGSDGTTFQMEAFSTTTHTPLWGLLSDSNTTALLAEHTPRSAGLATHSFVLAQGLIYFESTSTAVTILQASNGNQVMQCTLNQATISGFAVAPQN